MASAEKHFKVVLTLGEEEAETLLCVCRKIAGEPVTSRRGWMDNIARALEAVGTPDIGDDSVSDRQRTIYFLDEKGE